MVRDVKADRDIRKRRRPGGCSQEQWEKELARRSAVAASGMNSEDGEEGRSKKARKDKKDKDKKDKKDKGGTAVEAVAQSQSSQSSQTFWCDCCRQSSVHRAWVCTDKGPSGPKCKTCAHIHEKCFCYIPWDEFCQKYSAKLSGLSCF